MPSERVLVIEDEARIAQFIERGLIYEGYRVSVARDGQTGLMIARDNPPDLVVLDWMLPGLDGLEVCKRLRAASDVPILMLTAKDDIKDRVTGLDAGADDYLVKPFSVDELMARVRALFSPFGAGFAPRNSALCRSYTGYRDAPRLSRRTPD